MDEQCGPRFEGLGATAKRKRSQTSRRPRPESQLLPQSCDTLLSSSFLLLDDANKVFSDETIGDPNSKGKMFNLNQCMSRDCSASRDETGCPCRRIKEDGGLSVTHDNGDVGEGIDQGLGRHLVTFSDSVENEKKLKKVKLKVGGVTRTIQPKSSSSVASGGGSSMKSARSFDTSRVRLKPVHQGNFNRDHSQDKKGGLEGISWKEFSEGGSGHGKEDLSKMNGKSESEKQEDKSDPIRKSKRLPKKRVADGAFNSEDDDDEIRYLEKLKSSRASLQKDFEDESSKKRRSISRFSNNENLVDVGRSVKDGRKPRYDRAAEDTDYEEEEVLSECVPEGKKKKQKKDLPDSQTEIKREVTLTTRQRALLSVKDLSAASCGSQIEFPNGLPPPPPRKHKEKLSDVEQQLKKAEAAQRRRMQNAKAADESREEAIKKVLGQDGGRKKREEQRKKRLEELAQKKAANAQMLAGKTVRWVMSPAGTIVTFPQEMGLPQIFDSGTSSYPPPRDKCAGPSCSNPYKYRDSKSKLPLCSLQCYKAVHEKMQAEMSC